MESFQTITLVLADGRRVTYTGKVQLDHLFPPRVVEILVSGSLPLPEGCSWEAIAATQEQNPLSQ